MPQLEFWHFLPQFFWLVVCFTILYCVMAFVALPRIGSVLAKRKEKVETDLDAAEKARSQADAALEAHEASLTGARDEAHAVIAAASEAGARAAETRNRELDAEIAGQIEEARRAIADARSEAMDNLTGMAAEAARDATARLIGVEVSEDDVNRAVAASREA
ncbi:MAG: F0F1 ATP synthase subunit B' [Rhodospirillales bacterium]|nr:F0F1 ATP synthase subunit B' [Rhodospirillales bacterium]